MNFKSLLSIGLFIIITNSVYAQKSNSTHRTKDKANTVSAFKSKKHIYFPDYYAFYDPNRGYVFWNEESKTWKATLKPPTFMSNVDMSKTRIQILEGLSLDLHPEQNYPNYMKLYPAQQSDPKVPVPQPE